MSLKEELKQTRPFASLEEETHIALLRTSDRLSHSFERLLRRHGVTTTQYNVLRILRGALPGGLPCGEVGQRLVTRVPDVTRLLDRIERKGWARRERTTRDRRVVTIRLTPEGKKLVDALDEPVQAAHNALLRHLSREDLRALCDLLAKVRNVDPGRQEKGGAPALGGKG